MMGEVKTGMLSFGANGNGRRGDPRQAPASIRLDALFDQLPPNSPVAEMSLLGAMILDPTCIGEVLSIVRSKDDFYQEAHAAIFDALVQTYDRHQAGNLAVLAEVLRDREALEDVGGPAYLEKLVRETPGPATALHFAKKVTEKARLRELIQAAGRIAFEAYNAGDLGADGAKGLIDGAQSMIFEVASKDESTTDPQSLSEILQIEVEAILEREGEEISGVRTCYEELDEMLCGMQKGEMIIIAARPSMGKTALALNLAEQVAMGRALNAHGDKPGAPVAFFSLEMSKTAVAQRLLSAASGVSSQRFRTGGMTADEHERIVQAAGELAEAPIYIDDTPGLTVLGMRTRARRLKQQYGIGAIFIDYLQLMTAPGSAKESRQVEVAAISRGVKSLARELNVPVVCLSQLNRGPEGRTDNRPRMSDLRESGSIEQDADVVMLLHREEYYHIGDVEWESDPDNDEKKGVAELIVAKQRNGPTGVVKLAWDSSTTRFKNLARGRYGGGGMGGGGFSTGGGSGGWGGGGGQDAYSGLGSGAFKVPVAPFSPGQKSGPVTEFRDGGGPDKDDFEDDPGVPF